MCFRRRDRYRRQRREDVGESNWCGGELIGAPRSLVPVGLVEVVLSKLVSEVICVKILKILLLGVRVGSFSVLGLGWFFTLKKV